MNRMDVMVRIFTIFIVAILMTKSAYAEATENKPDTVFTGIYITSIHDIDFKQKEYSINLWLWMKYNRKEFDFAQNLEIPLAKTFTKSYSTIDTTGGKVYLIMKLQCVMKDSWKTNNFPFDKQTLRLTFENSQFDSRSLVFVADTLGENFDKDYTLRGWDIDSCIIKTGTKQYNTSFGVSNDVNPTSLYSSYGVKMIIKRAPMGLFWKLFMGMYVAFLIAYCCFYIHSDSMDSRFALSVGALFAVIGNKYIIDSSLPETTDFTLVDILHELTLLFILIVIAATAYSLKLFKEEKFITVKKFDILSAQIILFMYTVINIYLIWHAKASFDM